MKANRERCDALGLGRDKLDRLEKKSNPAEKRDHGGDGGCTP